MTTRTAAEALEEVLAQIAAVDGLSGMDRLEARLDSANAARNFIMKHAATLRAALAPPQEGEVEACLAWLDAESAKDGDGDAWRYAQAARLLRATQNNGHSPVGDESPRQNAKGAEGCHDAPNASGESPAQSSAAPTQPAAPVQEPVRYTMWSTSDGYVNPRADPEGAWVLYAALPQAAPTQEPVAWRYKERINCGQGQFIDSDWKLLPFRPMLGGSSDGGCSSGVTHLEPLYAAPQPDEARDAARLDWLERDDGEFYNIDRITAVVGIGFNRQPNLRNAIDAARKEQADATNR